MKIQRLKNIDPNDFLNEFILKRVPVIITDGMESWDVEKFRPDYLRRRFGDQLVQVYNNLFDLQDIYSLEHYFNEYFDKENTSDYYIRWYCKLKDEEFFWSDDVFEALKQFWSHPYFLPKNSFLVPYAGDNDTCFINEKGYPYKGLFISAKGARTRLHRDPFNSNAILCQFYGEKKIVLYSPDQEKYVMNNGDFVDILKPDYARFNHFNQSVSSYEDILQPGEIILFPSGWFHDVTCKSNSISITWNFVHSQEKPDLIRFVNEHPGDGQLEIAKYFMKEKYKNLFNE